MKRMTYLLLLFFCCRYAAAAQSGSRLTLPAAVRQLDEARTVAAYEVLAKAFGVLARDTGSGWLPWYYAAYCNARIGILYREEPGRIAPYVEAGTLQLAKARGMLDAGRQPREVSEILCVGSLLHRATILVSPLANGRKYGGLAAADAAAARELYASNPRALYAEALGKYHTPRLFGGDKDQARALARQALPLFERQGMGGTAPHWGLADVQFLLTQ